MPSSFVRPPSPSLRCGRQPSKMAAYQHTELPMIGVKREIPVIDTRIRFKHGLPRGRLGGGGSKRGELTPPNVPPEVPVPPEQPPLPVPAEPIPGPIPTKPTPVPGPPEPIPPNTPEPNQPSQPNGVRGEGDY